MTYLCAGLFAEGKTDYALLLPLLDQLIPALAAKVLPEVPMIGPSVGIDAPARTSRRRDVRIAASIRAYWDQCTLFVIHSDGSGDSERTQREQIEPGLELARTEFADLAAAACVPVREIEAWLLVDALPFQKLLPPMSPLLLPADPESVLDPKRALEEVLTASGGGRLCGADLYDFFGANIDPRTLRRLPAFRRFEEQLAEAILAAARPRAAHA
ncbi:hypothetical protein WMF45_41345 [Sorangium sp. So ce448]|uniref:hypothetical protein n=1 Tax=Sorangium sp. So ce448 TaxID=3133314 RepID=UPI003F62F88B